MKPSLTAIVFAACTTNVDYVARPQDTETPKDTADTTGNDTGRDTADTEVPDTIPPTITNVYAYPAAPLTIDTFLVYATIMDNVAVTQAYLTIDAFTAELTDEDSNNIYVSPAIAASSFAVGTYPVQITATDGINIATNTDAVVEITEPIPCPYTCSSNVCLYVDSALEAELNTPYPPQMTSIDIIRVGYGGQYVDNLVLNVAGIPYVSEDFSTSRGCFNAGTVSGGIYISEKVDNDCFFSPAFDATTEHWMVSIDVLAGSMPNFALRSSLYSSPGVNWDYVADGYINDGASHTVYFASGTPDTSRDHTIVMCNATL